MSAPSETSVKILIEFNKDQIATTSRQVEQDSSENTSKLEETPTIVLSESAQTSEIEELAPSVTSTIVISESAQTSSETSSQAISSSDSSDKDTEQSTVIISSSEDTNHQPIRHQSPPAPIIETEEERYQRYKRKRVSQWIQCQQRFQKSKNVF